jgi:hypothetical protein
MTNAKLALLAAAALAAAPAGAAAQSASPAPPMTAPTPPPSTMTMAPAPAPSPMSEPSNAPSTSAPAPTPAPAATSNASRGNGGNPGKHLGQIKKIPNGTLSLTNVRYGITHPVQEAAKVRSMKSISFSKLRVYRLSSSLKSMLKIGDANADIPALAVLGPPTLVAQTTPGTNGSNSPIAVLQYVLANINVSNALNNVSVLNNSNVNVGVSLQDVLNGNKISIGQVAGIFVDGLGVITTITK